MRIPAPGGTIGHAEIKIGNAIIMLADEFPEMNHRSPQSFGGTPVSMLVYV
jgi:PhnB protein